MSLVTPPDGFLFVITRSSGGKKHLSFNGDTTLCGYDVGGKGRQRQVQRRVCSYCWRGARGDEPQQVRFWKGEI